MATTSAVAVFGAPPPKPTSALATATVVSGGISSAVGLACLIGTAHRRRLYGRYIAAVNLRRQWQRGYERPFALDSTDRVLVPSGCGLPDDGKDDGTGAYVALTTPTPRVGPEIDAEKSIEIVPDAVAYRASMPAAATTTAPPVTAPPAAAVDGADDGIAVDGFAGCLRALQRLRFRRALMRVCTHDRDALEWFPTAERDRFVALYFEFIATAHADTGRRYRLYAEIEQIFRACCQRTHTGAIKLGQTAAVLGGVSLLGAVALELWR